MRPSKQHQLMDICAPESDYSDEQIVNMFLVIRCRSSHTYKSYSRAIRQFRQFIEVKRLRDCSWREVEAFKLYLMTKTNQRTGELLLPATIAAALAPVKSLYKWGSEPGIQLFATNPTSHMLVPHVPIRSKRHFLTEQEASTLLQHLQKQNNQRNYLMVLCMLVLGLRVSELCSIRLSDFYALTAKEGMSLTIVRGKGGKSRDIKVPATLWQLLEAYAQEHLLSSKKLADGNHERVLEEQSEVLLFDLTTRQIERIIKKAAAECGLSKPVTPHWLRHTNATIALLKGATLQQVQETLGHSHINTTQRYMHTVEQLEKAAPDYVNEAFVKQQNSM